MRRGRNSKTVLIEFITEEKGQNMKIGFIGLGIMGKPMVKNLMKGGYTDVLVNNRSRAAVDEVVSCGATAATNEEIGRQCDVVMTMLPNSPQVKEVMLGEGGVGTFMKEGSVFIDMSSINPVASIIYF